jgi:hypothetical protein
MLDEENQGLLDEAMWELVWLPISARVELNLFRGATTILARIHALFELVIFFVGLV